ncbi:hypothetical protein ACU4GD_40930 [Cupriavidus basilensis]
MPLETGEFVAAVPSRQPLCREPMRGDRARWQRSPAERLHHASDRGCAEPPGGGHDACRLGYSKRASTVPRVTQEAVQVQTIGTRSPGGERGLGWRLVPSVAARYANRRVRFLRLTSPRPAARIGIALGHAHRQRRSPGAAPAGGSCAAAG